MSTAMPGIAVPVPGAAEALALLDDQVVAEPGLLEPDGGADAGEAGADDQVAVIGIHGRILPESAPGPVALCNTPLRPGENAAGESR